MYTKLDDEWDPADIAHVTFRKVCFSDEPASAAQKVCTDYFRKAWRFFPPAPDATDILGDFMKKYANHTEEEWERLPKNPDMKSVHTPWREGVYYQFNHLFYDVSNFLVSMYGYHNMAHLHPPNSEGLALEFPGSRSESVPDGRENECGDGRVYTKIWETDSLLIPAYLAPGIAVRIETYPTRITGKDERKVRGKFDEENPFEIWYFQKGMETCFFIEGEPGQDFDQSVAATMVYGKLCDKKDCVDEEPDISS